MVKRRDYEELPDLEVSSEVADKVDRMTLQADREIEEAREGARVNFRWGTRQLNIVKQAAEFIGVPYQTYLKEAVLRQAMNDLRDAASLTRPAKKARA
jgi:predicted DNA binding CopG/RHH family protein